MENLGDVEIVFSTPEQKVVPRAATPEVEPETVAWLNSIHSRN